jgi:O-methyltransferase involved in polyketide biosynthesis
VYVRFVAESDSARISPTAHYTSYVWVRNGLSHPALASPLGRALYLALWPANRAYARLAGRPDLEAMLLARHRAIDERLARAVESGEVGQVIEIAAGFSARGWRFSQRYPGLRYIEADLPAQAAAKRRLLDGVGRRPDGHHVVPLDALVDDGPHSLAAIARDQLRPALGCAVVSEGLVNYFDRATVVGLWARVARVLAGFPRGLYLCDINLAGDVRGQRAVEAFRLTLQAFARGRVHLHFADAAEAEAALRGAGFSSATLERPAGGHIVRVIEARRG